MKFDFKEGQVTGVRTIANGSLYQIRVMPDMVNITENDLLPLYPNFFKDDHTAHQIDDVVWLLVNDDFHVGFILGQAQSASGDDVSTFIDTINRAELDAGLEKSAFGDLTVSQVGGVSIAFVNMVNGQSGIIYSTRIVILYGANGTIWIKNPNLNAVISPAGDLNIKGKAKTETFASSDLKVNADSTEEIGSKVIDSKGKMVLKTGGTFEKHVGSGNTEWVGGDSKVNILGAKQEIIAGGLLGGESRVIISGGSDTTVGEGEYSINVVGGGITISSILPISLTSTTAINMTAPIINLNGATIMLNGLNIQLNAALVNWLITVLIPGAGAAGGAAFI